MECVESLAQKTAIEVVLLLFKNINPNPNVILLNNLLYKTPDEA